MPFKFIHLADVHLDTPFKNRDKNLRASLKDHQRNAFKAAINMGITQKVDAILIAGDLFDSDTMSFATEKFLLREMNRLNETGIEVFYAPGNHDPYGSSSRMNNLTFPANVHVFRSSQPELHQVLSRDESIKVNIVGIGHKSSRENKDLAALFPDAQGDIPYIGLLHAFVTGVSKESSHDLYAPCTQKELMDKGYSYWALGHIHTRCELCSFPYIVYPGNIIGRNHGEEGPKGAYMVTMDSHGNVDASFEILSDVYWQTVVLEELTEAANLDDLEKMIQIRVLDYMDRMKLKGKVFLRLVLQGPSRLYNELKNDEEIEYLSDSLKTVLDVENLEIFADRVTKPIDIEKYRNEPHILGAVLSLLSNLVKDDEMLLKLCPDELGGLKGAEDKEKLIYLKRLLGGMDYEAAVRLIKEDIK